MRWGNQRHNSGCSHSHSYVIDRREKSLKACSSECWNITWCRMFWHNAKILRQDWRKKSCQLAWNTGVSFLWRIPRYEGVWTYLSRNFIWKGLLSSLQNISQINHLTFTLKIEGDRQMASQGPRPRQWQLWGNINTKWTAAKKQVCFLFKLLDSYWKIGV